MQNEFGLRSRTYAENLILRGSVTVNGKIATKPATDVDAARGDRVEILSDDDYASQGAYKIAEAKRVFGFDVTGLDCADIGCSNGGFTDFLLRCGAKSVLAADVGECALDERLVHDPRVTFLRANARELPPTADKDFLCADLSFISLRLVLKSFYGILRCGGEAVVLVKPQFEVGKANLSKKGIVLSEKERQKAVEDVKHEAEKCGFVVAGITPTIVHDAEKNVEYLLYLKKSKTEEDCNAL